MASQFSASLPDGHDHGESEEVIREQALAESGQSQAMYNYSQKLMERKERELMESIAKNYGRIREVERELGNLQLQLKLTAGPKKLALEVLRRKIEEQNERVAYVRAKHTTAKATYERLDAELKQEEAAKEQLCQELNMLVQQAARAQMDKLEQLKTQLESLYAGVLPGDVAQPQQQPSSPAGPSGSAAAGAGAQAQQNATGSGAASAGPAPAAEPESQQQQQQRQEQERQEQERKRQEAEAAERRRR
ncbi:hypothetical protein Agub_g7395, partial [Astrephomene gubernaculifera]